MIYLFLADGFEEIEAVAPTDILRRAGAQLQTVGVGGIHVTGSHGIEVTANLGTDGLVLGDSLDMVILPGGKRGTENLGKSARVKEAVRFCVDHGKRVSAICAAPSILGHMGLLKGFSATCYPGYEKELGAESVSKDPVCVSGPFITARGAGVAVDFALKIVEVLYGREKSRKIRENIQCVKETSGN